MQLISRKALALGAAGLTLALAACTATGTASIQPSGGGSAAPTAAPNAKPTAAATAKPPRTQATPPAGKSPNPQVSNFTVVNKTGFTIRNLYIDESKETDFTDDVLEQDVLENGASVDVKFTGYGDACKFDVRIVDATEKIWDVYELDLCQKKKVTFEVKDGKVVFLAE